MPVAAVAAALALMPATDFKARAADWTLGPVVYQVFPDRFAIGVPLTSKEKLYAEPRLLHPWSDLPVTGNNDPNLGLWSHETEFWGGDLPGITGKIDYIKGLGADVLYLTPIFKGYTNHKYDTMDYKSIDPQFGTMADFYALRDATHKAGMKLMLDGVFNHVGRHSDVFLNAQTNANDPHRSWFFFGDEYSLGYRAFANVRNMPTWKLENPAVRQYLWGGRDSVVKHWLKQGIDGWRLDVAFELGPEYLTELTESAHREKPGSPVVGEVSGYPSQWFPALDGTFNFFAIDLGKKMVAGQVSGGRVGEMLTDMVADAPYENLLKSWLLTDNHDTPRFASTQPAIDDRNLIRTLQFTLPGSPVVYYGSELGMPGNGDPANRAPMRWDLVTDSNPDLANVRKLIEVRRAHPALRYGDFTALRTDKLLAYIRTTDKLRQAMVVVVNPTDQPVEETFAVRIGQIMSWGQLKDTLSDEVVRVVTGQLTLKLPPKSSRIYAVVDDSSMGYSQYGRIK